ncbi:MAG: sigma 54-interacting transcriptional regulator, partial [Vicinamibacteria bacterium]
MSSQPPRSGPGPRGDGFPARHEDGFGRILGTNGRMLDVYAVLAKIGATRDTVLIVGDSGTGKELVARTLHGMSSRPGGRFVAFPCTAIPESLMESELLGEEADGAGCLEIAFGGTLFLDELSAIPIAIQGKLLGALKERTFRRLGGKRDIEIDLRVVAATASEPEVSVLEGRLRVDLLRELNALVLHIPPLQERSEDIPLLAREFVRDIALENGARVQG